MLELVEERVGLEGVPVPLQDRVRRQEGAVQGVVVLKRLSAVGGREASVIVYNSDSKNRQRFHGGSISSEHCLRQFWRHS